MITKKRKERVLVIAAHPDDEVLGCGGTVAKFVATGNDVQSLIACEGESHRGVRQERSGKHDAERAAAVLGVSQVHMLGFPDQKLDSLNLTSVITPIERVIERFQPTIVLSQYGGDINRDHELLFKATLVATRPTISCIRAVYAFDTASSTEWAYPRAFVPDTWVDIGKWLDIKLNAMSCYESEIREYPHPRSLQALRNKAHAWGNQACMDAAEVFVTVHRRCRDVETPT